MLRLQEGERVQIVERAATPADAKSGLYYGHYKGLAGNVFKLYGKGDTQQIAVDVDVNTLPQEVSRRHQETRDQMWNAMPPDARRASATGTPNEFRLRYIVLVNVADVKRQK